MVGIIQGGVSLFIENTGNKGVVENIRTGHNIHSVKC